MAFRTAKEKGPSCINEIVGTGDFYTPKPGTPAVMSCLALRQVIAR
jgi:hypothetical protein